MGRTEFKDRGDAGRALARLLEEPLGGRSGVLVLALPRGGVPVAFEVAQALGAPLDVLVVRKLGFPGQEELGDGRHRQRRRARRSTTAPTIGRSTSARWRR